MPGSLAKTLWHSRRVRLSVAFCLGTLCSVAAFACIRCAETNRLRSEFRFEAQDRVEQLQAAIERCSLGVKSLLGLYVASMDVERQEFKMFARATASPHVAIRAMAWAPLVRDAERADYEAAARREGFKGFQITQWDARGEVVRAARRDEYFPVCFLEPYEGNEDALGFDLASEPARLAALQRARETCEVTATAPIALVPDEQHGAGFLVLGAVYAKEVAGASLESRPESLRGVVIAAVRAADLVETALATLTPAGVDISVFDNAAPAGSRLIHFRPSPLRCRQDFPREEAEQVGLREAAELEVGGRRWSVVCTPAPEFLASRRTWLPWRSLAGGLALTGLAGAYLTELSRRNEKVRSLVREQTARLSRQNALLQAINRVWAEAVKCNTVEEVGSVCLGVAQELTGSKMGYVGRFDESGRYRVLAISETALCECRVNGRDPRAVLENRAIRGLWRKVLVEGATVLTGDPRSHPDCVGMPEGHAPITSFLAAPLKHGECIVGAIAVANKPSGYFGADREALEAVSCAFADALLGRAARDELDRQRQLLEAVLENIEAGVVACDAAGVLTLVNPAIRRLYGGSHEAITVDQWAERSDLYRPDGTTHMAKEEQPLLRAFRGEQVRNVELVIVPEAGPRRTILASGRPLFDQQGHKTGAVVVAHEITELREAEARVQQKDEQLRQSEKLRAIGELAGGVAHEFNNLLQAIQGYTQYAMRRLSPDEEGHQDLQQVMAAADRAAALTHQLLAFGRCQAIQRKSVRLNQVVGDLAKMVRPLIGEHIQLRISLDSTAGSVLADPGALQQALLNLCVNARDAMPSGGRLLIRTEGRALDAGVCGAEPHAKTRPHAVVTVSDTGCGMPPDVLEHVFEPFFTTKEVGKGTGLGLATVYGIVKQHEGLIRVRSEPGKGSTFEILLPAVEEARVTDDAGQWPASPLNGTEVILVVEDEPLVRGLAQRILEDGGYRVLTAADGLEAVEVFERHQDTIDLVLTDLVMPNLSGQAVCEWVTTRKPGVKVLFCSGHHPATTNGGAAGDRAVPLMVRKPFDAATLLRTVRAVLDADEPSWEAESMQLGAAT